MNSAKMRANNTMPQRYAATSPSKWPTGRPRSGQGVPKERPKAPQGHPKGDRRALKRAEGA